jgi:hypothetical protein
MRLKVKKIFFETGNMKDVVLNSKDSAKLNVKAGERVIVKNLESKNVNKKYWVAIVQIAHSNSILAPGEIGILVDTMESFEDIEESIEVSVKSAQPPDSYKYIKKKIKGGKLDGEEIHSIITDAVSGLLSKIEIASFITGVAINGLKEDEITALTLAETRSGESFDFGPEVYTRYKGSNFNFRK